MFTRSVPVLSVLAEDRHSQMVHVAYEALFACYPARLRRDLGVDLWPVAKVLVDGLARPVGFFAPRAQDVRDAMVSCDVRPVAAGSTAAWLRDALGGDVRR